MTGVRIRRRKIGFTYRAMNERSAHRGWRLTRRGAHRAARKRREPVREARGFDGFFDAATTEASARYGPPVASTPRSGR